MEKRHLDAKGKGEYSYDYANDIMVFRVKDRDYYKSVDFENFVVDFDKDAFVIGLRIFDASKLFRQSKFSLKNIGQWEFNARVEDKIISLDIRFTCISRNKQVIKQGQNFVREALRSHLHDSQVSCTA